MKCLISIIKFFNKRELEVLCTECERRSAINSMASINSQGDDIHYFKGKSVAYGEMREFIKNRMKEEDEK